MKTTHVFKTKGVPKYTYVSTTNGKYEVDLQDFIESRGTLCLVTGPSKTGKTTLVARVAYNLGMTPLHVRCVETLTPEEFWRQALEGLRFSRIRETSHEDSTEVSFEGKVQGKLGWAWLAEMLGEFTSGCSGSHTEDEIREKILAAPCAQHLIPVLKHSNTLLVVEDFHYLTDKHQRAIFQEWKSFVDEEVSVVVIGTTHHACDLAYANKDLTGRIGHVELGTWLNSDLRQIAEKGFGVLNVEVDSRLIRLIAEESVGLPILTQAICLELLKSKNIRRKPVVQTQVPLSKRQLFAILHSVATRQYRTYAGIFNRLTKGLRQDKRRYRTYEYLLLAFSSDPIKFSLSYEDLAKRITALPLPTPEMPPNGSVESALTHLASLQQKVGVRMLEWLKRDRTLFIVEPTFLFYLRWMKSRTAEPDVYDMLAQMLGNVVIERRKKGAVTFRFVDSNKEAIELKVGDQLASKASGATSEPAPSAASPAPQG
jgi:hypothetical protein